MWWLFHMLHNSEGNGCCVGNGCCDGPLVIYTAALTEKWTAEQNLPLSTAFTVSHRFWVVVFSFSFISMQINKETQTLNDTMGQLDLIDIYRTFHPKIINFTFFSSAHGTFSG